MRNRLALALSTAICLTFTGLVSHASQAAQAAADVPLVNDGLSGVVTGPKGPEAGVWVIAETTDLPTRFIKIVVTDDQGRYVLPELPKANYKVWVRGYGLVDSKPVQTAPGKKVNLTSVAAPDAKTASEYYPPNYWYALIKPPTPEEFPGDAPKPDGNGIAPRIKNQQMFMADMKECVQCHQIGDKATREYTDNTPEGWATRISMAREKGDHVVGNHGEESARSMLNFVTLIGRTRAFNMYADWTKRVAEGALPTEAPPRPAGAERNVVISQWDWGNGRFSHDISLTDRRNPTLLGNTPIYGAATFTGTLPYLDPVKHEQGEVKIPGFEQEHDLDAYPHTNILDQKGRVWVAGGYIPETSKLPDGTLAKRPDFCTNASDAYAKYYPRPAMAGAGESGVAVAPRTGTIMVYDPAVKKVSIIPTCFASHHLHFGRDANNTLFFSGDSNVIGWIDTKVYDDTKDTKKAIGWCPMVLDTNGDGKITPDMTQWVDAGKGAPDAKKDTRIAGFLYGMESDPVAKDGAMWFVKYRPNVPGGIVRFTRGANPPETCKSEFYEPPLLPDGTYGAVAMRGVSVDSKGIVWVSFATGQMGRFDRTKCKVTNGPNATGQQCPDGWAFYDSPGPKVTGIKQGSADFHYVTWVDLYDTLGMGKDVVLMPGSNSDSVLAMAPGSDKFSILRVPYPRGFYTRGLDGRIDNPNTGWKGRGLWASFSDVPVWHQEGGDEGAGPQLVKFQMRPSPLAY
jgi:hypothetical protein